MKMNDEQGKSRAAMQNVQTQTPAVFKSEDSNAKNIADFSGRSREMNGEAGAEQETECTDKEAAVDARVQAHIGRLLRARYQTLLDEPMPDRLRACLEQLAKKEEGS